jgi:transcriptional pleiotropic regulator of transition state genes
MVKGIVRKVDELGRITLPIEIRRSFALNAGDRLAISLDGQVIRIKQGGYNGMTRPIDELGRIALPIEYRRTLGLTDRQKVDMYIDGEDICVAKVVNGCGWCESNENLIEVNGHHICKKCALAVADAVMEG